MWFIKYYNHNIIFRNSMSSFFAVTTFFILKRVCAWLKCFQGKNCQFSALKIYFAYMVSVFLSFGAEQCEIVLFLLSSISSVMVSYIYSWYRAEYYTKYYILIIPNICWTLDFGILHRNAQRWSRGAGLCCMGRGCTVLLHPAVCSLFGERGTAVCAALHR